MPRWVDINNRWEPLEPDGWTYTLDEALETDLLMLIESKHGATCYACGRPKPQSVLMHWVCYRESKQYLDEAKRRGLIPA